MELDCFVACHHPFLVSVRQGKPFCQKWECYVVDGALYLVMDKFMELSRLLRETPYVALCTGDAFCYATAEYLGLALLPENGDTMAAIQSISCTRYPFRPLNIDPTTCLFRLRLTATFE